MQLLAEYGLFLLKTLTLVFAILLLAAGLAAIAFKSKGQGKRKIQMKHLNKKLDHLQKSLLEDVLSKDEFKQYNKQQKKREKTKEPLPRLWVLHFQGDLRATASESLREEVTALLSVAEPKDEVLVVLESAGGIVNGYGLCASQLARIRQRQIPLTIAIDKVAASGGYMMACVANKILAAPFAIVGSIGVVAQLPNFNRLLKRHHIDYEQLTAGEFKRTLTLFGENTSEGRRKVQDDIEETQVLFKNFIHQYRPQVPVEKVATGEHWYGQQALGLALVDELITSDDYLLQQMSHRDIYQLTCKVKAPLLERMMQQAELGLGWLRHMMG
jgi:serine protease SohB